MLIPAVPRQDLSSLPYRANQVIDKEVDKVKQSPSIYNFVSDDGIRHQVWKIADKAAVENIKNAFEKIVLYILLMDITGLHLPLKSD